MREGNAFTMWLAKMYRRFRPPAQQLTSHNPAEVPLLHFQPGSPVSPDGGKGSPPRPFRISDGPVEISPVLSQLELTRSPTGSAIFQRPNLSRSSLHSLPKSVSFRLDASTSQTDDVISPRSRLRRASSSYDDLGGSVLATFPPLEYDAAGSDVSFHTPKGIGHDEFLQEIPPEDGGSPSKSPVFSQIGKEEV
jgi:hypothetical protein